MLKFVEKVTWYINGKKNIRLVKSGENYGFFLKPEVALFLHALHAHFLFWYISLSFSAKQRHEMI